MKTSNTTFIQYIEGKDRKEIDFNLRYLDMEPIDLFKIGDITKRSFGFVKDIQDLLNYSGLTWDKYTEFLVKNIDVKEQVIYNENIYKLQLSRLWIKEQVEQVNELERIGLAHEPTPEEEAADLTRFNKYRSFMQFDSLTGGDVTKIDDIRNTPYMACFTKLKLEADRADFQKDLNRIYKLKQKK